MHGEAKPAARCYFQAEVNETSCHVTPMSITYQDPGLSLSLFACGWVKSFHKPFETMLVASPFLLARTDNPATRDVPVHVVNVDAHALNN
jgi:hypothetical protein